MIVELQSALHDSSLSKTEYIRVQAVLMRKNKISRHQTAQMVGKSIHAIEDWVTAYNTGGISELRTKQPTCPSRAKLTNKQREKIHLLLKKKPCDLGFGDEDYWTMNTVKQLVEKETKVVYQSINAYRKLLNEAGLSYQKVEFVDKHKNQETHDDFKKQFEAKVKGGRISMWW